MEERQEFFSLYVAVAVSLLIHATVIAIDVGNFTPKKKVDSLIFNVSMVDTMSKEDAGAAPPLPPSTPARVQKTTAKAPEPSPPTVQPAGAATADTSVATEAPPAAQAPIEIPKSDTPVSGEIVAIRVPAEILKGAAGGSGGGKPGGVSGPASGQGKSLSLKDLKPSREDVITLAPMTTTPPDPAKEKGEVTLSLGDPDLRYRGYLDRVRSAVDRSWNWREALLAADRPGSVTVRVTIERSGQADAVLVTSSGSKILDNETIATVKRAQLPNFPEEWAITKLNLIAEFQYTYGN